MASNINLEKRFSDQREHQREYEERDDPVQVPPQELVDPIGELDLDRFDAGGRVGRRLSRVKQLFPEAGPGTLDADLGEFITDRHTLENFKKELWFPRFADRDSLSTWEHKAAPKLIDRLRDRAKSILEEHQPTPLATDISKQISEILG